MRRFQSGNMLVTEIGPKVTAATTIQMPHPFLPQNHRLWNQCYLEGKVGSEVIYPKTKHDGGTEIIFLVRGIFTKVWLKIVFT